MCGGQTSEIRQKNEVCISIEYVVCSLWSGSGKRQQNRSGLTGECSGQTQERNNQIDRVDW